MNAKSLSMFCAFAILAAAVLATLKPEAQAGDFCRRPRVFAQNFHHGHAFQFNNVYGHGHALQLNNAYGHNAYGFHYDLAKVYVSVGQELINEAAEERLLRRLEARREARQTLENEAAPASGQSAPSGSTNSRSAPSSDAAPSASPLADSHIQALFNSTCTRCHSSAETGIDLTNADALTPEQRAKVAIQVDLGLMPPGGQQVSDEDTYVLKMWAAGKVDTNGRELE